MWLSAWLGTVGLWLTTVSAQSNSTFPPIDKICTLWNKGHVRTFDNEIYSFISDCNIPVSSNCKNEFTDFDISAKRDENGFMKYIRFRLEATLIVIEGTQIKLDGDIISPPFTNKGISIKKYGLYQKIKAKLLGVSIFWNKDFLSVVLEQRYAGTTCGVCGNFDGNKDLPLDNNIQMKLNLREIISFQDCFIEYALKPPCASLPLSKEKECTDIFNTALTNCPGDLLVEFKERCLWDHCTCEVPTDCVCMTVSDYSYYCSREYESAINWRTPEFCGFSCPPTTEFSICGNSCIQTCANPVGELVCEDPCIAGCFCPQGTVFSPSGECIPVSACPCEFEGILYEPTKHRIDKISDCECGNGQWSCKTIKQISLCSLEGNVHLTTFDHTSYNVFAECKFTFASASSWVIEISTVSCGPRSTQTCLSGVTFSTLKTNFEFRDKGVFTLDLQVPLPYESETVSIYYQSSMVIELQTSFGIALQVHVEPIMKVYLHVPLKFRGKTKGLCGNFNGQSRDDFYSSQGILESTPAVFLASWQVLADCPAIGAIEENPCIYNLEKKTFAEGSCSLLKLKAGPFALCHNSVSPDDYYKNCLMDVCNAENIIPAICAALSSYAHACAVRGTVIIGWRQGVCAEPSCPGNQIFSYTAQLCSETCRSLGDKRLCLNIDMPVEGCICPDGLYLNSENQCVKESSCNCYLGNRIVAFGASISVLGKKCLCEAGQLYCDGETDFVPGQKPNCTAPKEYVDCIQLGDLRKTCERTCRTYAVPCAASECVVGCVCPSGMILDDLGKCVFVKDCSCERNGILYADGDTIKVDCNQCACNEGKWICTTKKCPAVCKMYGDGHYVTFDGHRYLFDGKCAYTVAQDYCGESRTNGTFQIITENEECGTTGTTCSRSVKIFLKKYNLEVQLKDGNYKIIPLEGKTPTPNNLAVESVGLYRVFEMAEGITVIWDGRTSIFIKISREWSGKVCGLCANFNGDVLDDMSTRAGMPVTSALDFGNSWKMLDDCPDITDERDPCTKNVYRQVWAEKKCSMIQSDIFKDCHKEVYHIPYYEACVRDSCACDSGGDCECLCTAIAAYAAACNEAGVCIRWRTPELCPVFCDYYNKPGQCVWHYNPCGTMPLTCHNLYKSKFEQPPLLEGCYPTCPDSAPYLDENSMTCVPLSSCSCYIEDQVILAGTLVPFPQTCSECTCTKGILTCSKADGCCYGGEIYSPGTEISIEVDELDLCTYNTTCSFDENVETKVNCITTTAVPATTVIPPELTTTVPTTLPVITFTPITTKAPVTTQPETTFTVMTTIEEPIVTETPITAERPPITMATVPVPTTVVPTAIPPPTGVPPTLPPVPPTMVPTAPPPTTVVPVPTIPVLPTLPPVPTTAVPTVTPLPTGVPPTFPPVPPTMVPTAPPPTTVVPIPTVPVPPTLPPVPTTTIPTVAPPPTGVPPTLPPVQPTMVPTAPPPTTVVPVPTVPVPPTLPPVPTTAVLPPTGVPPTLPPVPPTVPTAPPPTTVVPVPTVPVPPTLPPVPTTAVPTVAPPPTGVPPTLPPVPPTVPTAPPPTTAVPVPTVPVPPTLPPVPTTVIPTAVPPPTGVPPTLPPVPQTTVPPATTQAQCYCELPGGEILRPGDIIYNSTIVNGLCRIAKCNENCQVTASQVPCVTTAKPTVTTAPSPAPPTTGKPPTDCTELVPTRVAGETWTENCNTYTCIGNGKEVSVIPKSCADVVETPCASGKKATKVLDADGCCFQWQCGCSCISTENSQMKTFDGVIFDYPDNPCSYILVQEIDSVYDFSVEMNNYYCDARTTICSRGLTINFRGNSMKAMILSSGEMRFQKNQEEILKTPFNEDGFVGFMKNNAHYINIPEMKASIMVMGKSFSIDLPYAIFNGNTEGLCGTCTNSTAEECTWRDGSVENDDCCANTAMDWLIPDATKAGCLLALPEEYHFCVPPPTPPPSCTQPEGQYCELIRNEVFTECMEKVNVDFYLQGCLMDPCVDDTERLCDLLKTAAFACGAEGICVDWLSVADFCAYECPPDMVHRPCRTMPVNICGTSTVPTNEVVPEGCFCAGDKKQLNTTSDICVDDCPECYSSDGTPKVADERWAEDCSICTCNPGQKTTCEIAPCPIPSLNCAFDLPPVVTPPQQGECCPDYKCPTCTHEGVTYQPGDRWTDPSSNCTNYYCNPFSAVVSISESSTVCGPVDILNCTGPIMYDSSGCCPISCLSISEKCQPMQIQKVLQDGLCTSFPVTLQECNGFCSSTSSFDVTIGSISHKCYCCKESDVEERSAKLTCPDGTVKTKSYIYIKSCACNLC